MPVLDLSLRDNTPPQPLPEWSSRLRPQAIVALSAIETRVAEALANCDDLIVSFGDEFEFSGDQVFTHLTNAATPASAQIETGNIVGYIRSRQHGFGVQVTSRFGESFL